MSKDNGIQACEIYAIAKGRRSVYKITKFQLELYRIYLESKKE